MCLCIPITYPHYLVAWVLFDISILLLTQAELVGCGTSWSCCSSFGCVTELTFYTHFFFWVPVYLFNSFIDMSEAGSNPFGLSEVEFAFYEFAKSSGKVRLPWQLIFHFDLLTRACSLIHRTVSSSAIVLPIWVSRKLMEPWTRCWKR